MTFCDKTFASSHTPPNNKPCKLLIAGAISIPGLQEIAQTFATNGIQVDFIEAPFMKTYLKKQTDNASLIGNADTCMVDPDKTDVEKQPCVTYTDNPAPDIPVIPLSEYWISFCLQTGRCRIARRALEASRSKKYFYSLMASAGFEAVHCFTSEQDAINYLKTDAKNSIQHESDSANVNVSYNAKASNTRKVLIKPNGLNSGLGIEIVTSNNVDLLGKYIVEAQNIKTKNLLLTGVLRSDQQTGNTFTAGEKDSNQQTGNAFTTDGQKSNLPTGNTSTTGNTGSNPDNTGFSTGDVSTTNCGNLNSQTETVSAQISCLITEYIEGTEYSADCFYFLGQVVIVRVCRKRIAFINNRPCTLVYQLITPPKEIEKQLIGWTSALFDKNDISFAQFDFIVEQRTNRIVPIDFAARIGGGIHELMSFTKPNCYAKAIELAFTAQISSNTQKTDASDNPDTNNREQPILTQLNYLSAVKGHIVNDNYKLASGVQFVFKHKGDYVTSLPSSVGSRIALVIQQNNNENLPSDIEESLLLGEDWIK